jgi:AraC family transcriptional regulator
VREAVIEAARFITVGCEQALTLADVADHVGYSPFHLARAFERQLGMPPGKFLAAQRFHLAKQLLLDTDEKIVDVCNAVGFCAPGTFTTRFTAAVGVTPQRFRRLPDLLADHPPEPVSVPGLAIGGGTVTGRALVRPTAVAALGGSPPIYVGLFPRLAARGVPVSGALLGAGPEFTLTDVPHGSYRLMACALPVGDSPRLQLAPSVQVVGSVAQPVHVRMGRRLRVQDLWLDLAPAWTPPVLVALPPLACAAAQEWRSPAQPVHVG